MKFVESYACLVRFKLLDTFIWRVKIHTNIIYNDNEEGLWYWISLKYYDFKLNIKLFKAFMGSEL